MLFFIDGANACPPEDYEGLWGYQEMLKSFNNPDYPKRDHYQQWLAEIFDPNHFDREVINKLLKKDTYGVFRF